MKSLFPELRSSAESGSTVTSLSSGLAARCGSNQRFTCERPPIRMSVSAVIGAYRSRWNIETTFQEMRSELGLETTRGWREKTVLRAAPCLFGLYTVVAILFHALPESKRTGAVEWPGKTVTRFSDALAAVAVGRVAIAAGWSSHGMGLAKIRGARAGTLAHYARTHPMTDVRIGISRA